MKHQFLVTVEADTDDWRYVAESIRRRVAVFGTEVVPRLESPVERLSETELLGLRNAIDSRDGDLVELHWTRLERILQAYLKLISERQPL